MKKALLGVSVLLLFVIILVLALAGYLVTSHLQALTLPLPSGPYSVGRSEYDWTDESRIDPLSDTPNEKRELLVWIWYPAAASQPGPSAPYLPPVWVAAHNKDQGIGNFFESDYSAIRTHSFANAPLAGSFAAYPVLIMQPGMGPVPTDYTVLVENLASHGYIVAGINPTYTSNLVVFPDWRSVPRSTKGTIPDSADAATLDQDANRIENVWAEDVLFVIGNLQGLNADPSSPFYNKLDLAHIGDFGHSLGGATAIRVCAIEARCKAAADLDGTLFSEDAAQTLRQPILFMTEDACGSNCETMHQVYARAEETAYYLAIKGTKHFNFSDLPLRLNPLIHPVFERLGFIGPIQPERGLEISNAYLTAFFDQYLKGINSALLHDPSPEYPEVELERR